MYNNQAAYMYPQQQQMHMQQQMQQRRMQLQLQQQQQMQKQQQQQQQHMQQQQQILQARKKQVHDKQQQKQKDHQRPEDDGEDDEEYEDDEDDDEDESDESFSSPSELSTDLDMESGSDDGSATAEKGKVTFDSHPKSKSKSRSKKSKAEFKAEKTNAEAKAAKAESKAAKAESKAAKAKAKEDEKSVVKATAEAEASAGADDMARETQKLAMRNLSPTRIPSSALSPGEYMYNVISDVLDTNNKKNFQRILARTPLPIALKYLHQIAQKAFATGSRDIFKVVLNTNKKYNVVSDLYLDAFAKGDSKSITNAMNYLVQTVQAFTTGAEFNTDELLKFFTPEFIAMNLIQSKNIGAYDKVMTEFKNEEIRISRGFHVAKPLLAAYFGVPSFFSNQKRYTFNRDIIALAICGGSTETLDYVIKKTKIGKISHDIVLEARSCQPIPSQMMKHLVDKYSVSVMLI